KKGYLPFSTRHHLAYTSLEAVSISKRLWLALTTILVFYDTCIYALCYLFLFIDHLETFLRIINKV
ncbi:hypothetical protein GWI33_011292, partial [Rhynchophorus ferrugineus]